MTPDGTLSTVQVAAYLGVKVETVYAYVSRGVLTPVRRGGPGGSLFDAEEVADLRDGVRRPAARAAAGASVEVRTRLTQVMTGPDRLAYRGRDVVQLSRTATFEEVCTLLWQQEEPVPVPTAQESEELARLLAALPPQTSALDRFKHAVLLEGGTDHGRHDRRPGAFVAAGARIMGLLVRALAEGTGAAAPAAERGTVAARVAAALGTDRVEDVDATLVLLADHDMAVSTTALRVAVSGGADLSTALLAALAAADSPLHVGAPSVAHGWLRAALEDPRAALGAALAAERPPAGFGHVVYREADPRADELYRRLRERCPGEVVEAVDLLAGELLERRGWPMTVDLPLALWALVDGLPRETGSAVFALARTAGWVAHAVEELAEPGMRFRLTGLYTGER
ncbi:citrate/2-methylcitrate synthase [Ornithinimicrobium avium]|uniref:citrate synthase (unknown stereospecificity) n=1 Tax=Ornithinimicrobium avium TaxID=2283195 RepID=A0A345NM63_9MICO|nr:citrate/2-methylcitrate synthase [Ornithinimicrobium avium]AXH96121.1 helix-turn-helix domain-containing protein [Ornithinimicrobium avium]